MLTTTTPTTPKETSTKIQTTPNNVPSKIKGALNYIICKTCSHYPNVCSTRPKPTKEMTITQLQTLLCTRPLRLGPMKDINPNTCNKQPTPTIAMTIMQPHIMQFNKHQFKIYNICKVALPYALLVTPTP